MFVDVILPLPFSELFTYSVPEALQREIGKGYRVVVPFGSKKHYTAIVRRLHHEPPRHFETKEIHSAIDSHPVVNEQQLRLWEWISSYYMSPLGDVYKAALPPSMKPEDLQQKITPRTETFLHLNPSLDVESASVLIGRAKKQQALFGELKGYFQENGISSIRKKAAMSLFDYSPAIFNGLIQKNVVQTLEVEDSAINSEPRSTRAPFPLNDAQQKALEAIQGCFAKQQVCLLHGVTSSGKTEIYIHLLNTLLSKGMQALYLVPEIALTTQLTDRLQSVFGNKIAIYHSKISNRERVEIWQKMLSDHPYEIILGVRSSLFLPFRRLGLVIVDEEHETSYKQQDPAPRYHARDTAIMLGHMTGAKTLLGSATPSLESYHNARKGKYGLVTLGERYNTLMMPEIRLEDTSDLRRRKRMKSLLAPALIEQMETALANGEQVILFRNRRGFASLLECKQCGWIPKCSRCDVALTYHKQAAKLVCHYCNATRHVPRECPSCHSENLKPLGLGTERLEEEVSRLFPGAVVARMDTDTTRGKESLENLVRDFQEKRIQILVGTQMLSKGLDFENVRVVGIISADSLLNYPDFRSHERGFQLMLQSAGRAGRRDRRGSVVIQSNDPHQPIYGYIMENDYESFYLAQLGEREYFRYPPFYRLIRVIFKHKDEKKAETAVARFADLLKGSLHERVLGPNKPVVSRVQRYHIREILLKLESGLPVHRVRDYLIKAEKELRGMPEFRYMTFYYDVDPV